MPGAAMVDTIRNFQYKTAGRGKGVLGVRDLKPCRRPGERGRESEESGDSAQPGPREEGRVIRDLEWADHCP